MAVQDERSIWEVRAVRLLDAALYALADEASSIDDVLSNISLARACIHVELGEMPAEEFDGYAWPDEEQEEDLMGCICPSELVERGGFKGGCPVHGRRYGGAAR